MRRLIASLAAGVMLVTAATTVTPGPAQAMPTPAVVAQAHAMAPTNGRSCPDTFGTFCFWNKSYFYGSGYRAEYAQGNLRLGTLWNWRLYSYKVGSSVDWILYRQSNCRGDYVVAKAGTQNSYVRNEPFAGLVGSVGPRGGLQRGC
jgi:hypothetical protein